MERGSGQEVVLNDCGRWYHRVMVLIVIPVVYFDSEIYRVIVSLSAFQAVRSIWSAPVTFVPRCGNLADRCHSPLQEDMR